MVKIIKSYFGENYFIIFFKDKYKRLWGIYDYDLSKEPSKDFYKPISNGGCFCFTTTPHIFPTKNFYIFILFKNPNLQKHIDYVNEHKEEILEMLNNIK